MLRSPPHRVVAGRIMYMFVPDMGEPVVAKATESPLLGRERELATIDELLSAVTRGGGRACLITGPAGIGKTALLGEARARAGARGIVTRQAAGMRIEREYAFGAVRALFDDVVRAGGHEGTLLQGAAGLAGPALGLPAAVADGGEGVSDPASAAMHGLYWLSANLAERGPMLLTVDDAHWLDPMSLRYALYLARRLHDLPILMLVAARPEALEAQQELLDALAALPDTVLLAPAALAGPEVRQVVARSGLPDAASEFVSACARVSGGNPYLLGELLDGLKAEGVTGSATEASRVDGVTPEGVISWVASRLASLGPEPQALAGALAVLGAGGRLAEASLLSGLDQSQSARSLDRLIAAHIVTAEPPHDFAHPLVHTAVYEGMPRGTRSHLHARAASLLSARGGPAALVATQLLAAPPSDAAWAVETLRSAAREATAAGAPDSAVRYLERALAESPAPGERGGLLLELGQAQLCAGRPEAVGHIRDALALHDDRGERARIWLHLARALYWMGDAGAAGAACESGLAEVPEYDGDLTLELYGWQLIATPGEWDPPVRVRERVAALESAGTPGRTRSERMVLAQMAYLEAERGELSHQQIRMLATRALHGGALLNESAGEMGPYSGACAALHAAGDLLGALAAVADAIRRSRDRGSPLELAWFSMFSGQCNFSRGAISDALADLDGASDEVGAGFPRNRVYRALCLLERGELDAARSALPAQQDADAEGHLGAQLCLLYGWGLVRAAEGRLREALELLLACEPIVRAANGPNPAANEPWRPDAAVLAARLGERDLARSLATEELRLARAFGASHAIGRALRAAGLIEPGPNGIELLAESVDVLAGTECQLLLAHALSDHGAALRRAGHRREAREPLRAGLDLATRCGAHVLGERARAELVAAGARPRRERMSGAEALTASELRVARMAAEGLSNRAIAQALFVSLRTVETHLTRIYQKLDLDSRDGLAASLGG